MTARKTERLMGLLIMLLVQRRPVPKATIRRHLYGDEGDAAFEKKFERDKDELRSLGVPIEVTSLDSYFDDEVGYRVRPDAFALPAIELEADEASVLGLAGKVWEHARLAGATTDALRKLTALGIEVDSTALDLVQPRIGAAEPTFPLFWEATTTRTPVAFRYASRKGETALRHLQPWAVVRFSGRWYVTGLDTDRGEERVFRLSRVVGEPVWSGDPESYDVPEGVDPAEVARRLTPAVPAEPAEILVREGTCSGLRRIADTISTGARGPDDATGWDRLELSRSDLLGEVLACGSHAYVVGPPGLREEVVTRLRRVVDAAGPREEPS